MTCPQIPQQKAFRCVTLMTDKPLQCLYDVAIRLNGQQKREMHPFATPFTLPRGGKVYGRETDRRDETIAQETERITQDLAQGRARITGPSDHSRVRSAGARDVFCRRGSRRSGG